MLLVVLFPLAFHARAAAAQSNAVAAEQLYRDGNTLQAHGKIHEACLKFVASEKLDPQLGTLLNVASCHEKEGRVATAWSEYSELVDAAAAKGDKKRGAYAKHKVDELGRLLPRLALRAPAGINELRLDGVVLGKEVWTSPIPVDPGDHEILYGAAGKKPGSQHVTAAIGVTTPVTLQPLADVDAVVPPTVAVVVIPAPAPVVESAAPVRDKRGLRSAGIATGAVGIVGLGVGAAFGALALGSKGDVNRACTANQCSQAGLNDVSSARTQGAVSTIGLVAGGVFVAAGVTMILVAGKTSTVSIAPTTGGSGGGAGMALLGAF